MERLDYLNHAELLLFFHCQKTLMSCMDKPHTFLSQLRDHDLIPEDRYKNASHVSSREKLKKALYDVLDQFERERPQDIRAFWKCVFNDVIMNQYPTLRRLHNCLMDGSFHFGKRAADEVEAKRKAPSDADRKRRRTGGDEEQPGPSSRLIPASSMKKEETDAVWAPPAATSHLPVTCGDLEGTLVKDRLAKGEKCILFQKQWFTPSEFERRAGRQSSRNWKLSIRSDGSPLGRLIQEGHLTSAKYKGGCKKDNRHLRPSGQSAADDEEGSRRQEADRDGGYAVFKVTCDDVRFEAGANALGVSPAIRCPPAAAEAERVEPAKVASCQTDVETEETSKRDEKRREVSEVEVKGRGGASVWGSDEQQPGPSSQLTSGQRNRAENVCVSASTKKEQRNARTWFFSQSQLPVTCGDLAATLSKDRLAKGEKCVLFREQWFTPNEFERLAGKKSSKNWKLSIRCDGSPLGRLIQDGHLASVKYKGGCKKVSEPLCPGEEPATDEEESERLEGPERSSAVFDVTCGAKSGILHKKRFASGSRGLSVRTETRWMTPEEFVKEASCEADASWRDDIEWKGKPLGVLVETNVLTRHPDWCQCENCQPDQRDLENQQNDDECCVCRRDEPKPVPCEFCPRCFHRTCHLPHVEDADLRDDRPWMCTFCEFSHYGNGDELEMRAAMSQYMSCHTLKCQYLLLWLRCADGERTSAANPNGETPASIGTVASRLQAREYQTVGEFVSDVRLVFAARARDAQDGAASARLREMFHAEFKKVFNVR